MSEEGFFDWMWCEVPKGRGGAYEGELIINVELMQDLLKSLVKPTHSDMKVIVRRWVMEDGRMKVSDDDPDECVEETIDSLITFFKIQLHKDFFNSSNQTIIEDDKE